MPLPNINKVFQTQEFGLEIHSGEVTRKQPQQRLSTLACDTPSGRYQCLYQTLSKYV